jgi:hypothetical protein
VALARAPEAALGALTGTALELETRRGQPCPDCATLEWRAAAFLIHGISMARWCQRAMLLAARTRQLTVLTDPADLAVEAWRLTGSAERFRLPGPVVEAALAAAADALRRREATLDLAELLTHPTAATDRSGHALVGAQPTAGRWPLDPGTDERLVLAWLTPSPAVRALPAAAAAALVALATGGGWTAAWTPCPEALAPAAVAVATRLVAGGMELDQALPLAVATVQGPR